jgi:hypothetical protein
MSTTADIALRRLESKLDKLALDQLRRVAAALYEELEATKDRLAWAEQEAELCRQERDMLHEAMANDDFATHRKVGINPQGELLVVKLEH